jgi:hypothetical protein
MDISIVVSTLLSEVYQMTFSVSIISIKLND